MSEKYNDFFVIKRVKLYKFGSYRSGDPIDVFFDGNTIAIRGETGAGKSTILDAIVFPLWKTTPRMNGSSIKISDICQVGGYAEVEFEKNGHLYIIRRKLTKDGSEVELTIDGKKYPETKVSVVDPIIGNIMGMNYKTLSFTSFIAQDTVKDVLKKTPKEVLEVLKEIFQIDVYDIALKILNDKSKILADKLLQSKTVFEETKKFIGEEESIKKLVVTKKEQISPILADIERISNILTNLQKRKESIYEFHEKYVQSIRSEEILKKNLDALEKDIASLVDIPNDILISLRKEVDIIPILEKRSEVLNDCTIIETENKGFKDQIEKLILQNNKRKNEINLDQKKYDVKGKELLNKFRFDPSIKIDYVYDVIKSEVVQSIYERIDGDIKKNVDEITEKIKKNNDKVVVLLKENQIKISDTPEKLRKELGDLRVKKNNLSILETKAKNYSENRGRIEKSKVDMIEELNKVSLVKKESESKNLEYLKFDEKFNQVNSDYTKKVSSKSTIEGEIKQLEDQIKKIQDFKQKNDSLKDKITELGRLETIYEVGKKQIFHQKGMSTYALKSILEDLQRDASEYIRILTSHRNPPFTTDGVPRRFNNIILKQSERRGGGIEIEVDGSDARRFSGGEQTLISLSLHLAFSKKLCEMPSLGAGIRTLIIDEGDLGSLDDETKFYFMDLIDQIKESFDKIIIITHLQGITDDFDTQIYVKIDENGFSSIS